MDLFTVVERNSDAYKLAEMRDIAPHLGLDAIAYRPTGVVGYIAREHAETVCDSWNAAGEGAVRPQAGRPAGSVWRRVDHPDDAPSLPEAQRALRERVCALAAPDGTIAGLLMAWCADSLIAALNAAEPAHT